MASEASEIEARRKLHFKRMSDIMSCPGIAFPVVVLILLICTDVLISTFVIYPRIGQSWFGVGSMIVYNALFVYLLFSYCGAVIIDPGYCSTYPMIDRTSGPILRSSQTDTGKGSQACDKCRNGVKTAWVHHCESCKKCVHSMDHHW